MRRSFAAVRVSALVFVLAVCAVRAADPPPAGAKPLTAEQKARLQECDRLAAEAAKFAQAGKLADMLAAWEQKLAIEREVYGPAHERVAVSVKLLALIHEGREDFPAARKARQEVLAIRRQLHGDKDWRVADARRDLAEVDRLSRLTPEDRRGLQQATALNQQVALLLQRGHSRQALPLARRALAIRRQLLGEDHPLYAQSLNNLAELYGALGDPRQALPLHQQARDLRQRILGEDHPLYAQSLNNLAALYQALGDPRQALALFEQARDLQKRILGADHPDYARSLDNLAALYQVMGDYPKALPLSEQARDLYKRILGADHPDYAISLNNLATLYLNMGDPRKALPLLEQVRDLRKRILGVDHPDYANSLHSLATLYHAMGDPRKALPLLEQACVLRKRILGMDHPDYAKSLNDLAMLYRAMGDHRKALLLLGQARDLRKRILGADHPDYGESLNNLALLYQDLGDYRQALALSEQARDLAKRRLGEDHRDYVANLNNLAILYKDLGDYRQALPLYQQVRDFIKRRLGTDHPHYAISLNNLARLYMDMGEYRQALPLSEQACDLFKRIQAEDHPGYTKCLNNLALVHIARNHYAQATPPVTEALTRQRAFLDRTFAALSGRQRLDALQQHQHFLHSYLSIVSETGIAAAASYPHVLAWKGAVAARHAAERLALDQSELQPLLDELRQRRAGRARLARFTAAGPQQQADWQQRFDEMERGKEELETRLAGQSEAFRQYRALRQATARQVADALPPATALVDFLEYTHYGPPPEGKGKPKGEGRLLAFVMARGREPVCVQLGPSAPVAQAVLAWRRPIQSFPPGPLNEGAARELVRRVWQPLQPHLAGASVVLLAPDGALTALPFAALPGGRPGSFLLEEVALGYVTSGRQLLEQAVGSGRPADGLLALGGLPYGAAPDAATLALLPGKAALEELPGTRLEVERIERTFRRARPGERVTLLTGATVDAARLQRALPAGRGQAGYRFLHLATHGFFEPPPENLVTRPLPDDPLGAEYRTFVRNPMLLSGLVLAGANRDPAKAVLTAEEVAGLDLRGAELVVLSACDTALGRVAAGEGVLGLQRGFHEAGARALAASLWSVSDAATSVLMEEFYANLWEKRMTRLEALRQAQLVVLRDPGRVEARAEQLQRELAKSDQVAVLRGGSKKPVVLPEGGRVDEKSRRRHPAYWAAFVLSGDTGAIPPPPKDKAPSTPQPDR
jgi:CHAT domain-containing protein/tetratricopeptide (TPR) repeat protein